MGEALVTRPTSAAADDADNEFGRCMVCRGNCCKNSSQDLCQTRLRCNVNYKYQNRTFPKQEIDRQETTPGASEHLSEKTQQQKL